MFKTGFKALLNGTATRTPQKESVATSHKKSDLKHIMTIQPDLPTLIKLRALTTNRVQEAVYFEQDEKRYAVQVKITELRTKERERMRKEMTR